MLFRQVANGSVRKCRREPAKLDCAVVSVFGGELRSFAVRAASAWLVGADKFIDRFIDVLALHSGHGAEVALDLLSQRAPVEAGGRLAIRGHGSKERDAPPAGLAEGFQAFKK